ncbi:MAG: SurA N-terminal domain-containing protein [Xanthobacteraceae bacterium]
MLRGIHNATKNWFGRIVMGVVLTIISASFAVWGINDIFNGYGGTYVAKIGDTEIPLDQYSQAYNNRLQQLSQEVGHSIPPEQANALGLDRQVLSQLLIEAGLDQRAQQMRLGVPTEQIVQHILSDPHFQTPAGQFDRAAFGNFLQNVGYSEQQFIEQERRTIPRREMTDAISGGIVAPKVYLDAVNQFQNQQRSIAYVALGPQQAGDIPQPSDDVLNKYFDDRKILFRAPEYRKIDTIVATPATVAQSIKVSDADVKKRYEANLQQYITPERRHVEQIVFPTMAEATAASARIKSGVSFAAIAAERGLKQSDIDLGTVAKAAIVDPAVAKAAFSLKQGDVSAPIQGRFGAVIVTVLQIDAGSTKQLSVVAPFIRNDIALERAKDKVQDIHDTIEDARAGGATLEEAAQKVNLPVTALDIDRSGRDPSGKLVATMPAAGDVISGTFANDVGFDTYPIDVDNGYVWYEVEAITPARNRTLSEVRPEVERRWRDDEIAKRLKAKAADMLTKLKTGGSLDALATANGVKSQTAADLKRGVSSPGVAPKVIDAVFHTAKGAFNSSEADTPTHWVVFQVTDVRTPKLDPNSPDGKKLVQLLQTSIGDDVFGQYVAWLEKDLGTTVNQSMLAQASSSGAPDTE